MNSPIRIAYCITELDPGGAERALVQLVTRLDRSMWKPKVFCLSGEGALVRTLEEAGVSVVCLNARIKFNPLLLVRFIKELRKFKPQILHSYLFHANIAGRVAAWFAKVPHVISGIRVAEKRSRLPLIIDRFTQWFVDMNICVSQDVAQFSIEQAKLSVKKIMTIPNGVEFDRFAKATAADLTEFNIPPEAKTVISVGRLDPQKNPLAIVEAATILIKEHPDWHYLFVGDGILKDELSKTIQQKGLQDHVHLAGQRDDIPALLKAADCFVMTSLWEGMPNALLEAMASGLPVLTTRVEGAFELIEEGVTGYIIEPDSTDELTSALKLVMIHLGDHTKMGNEAQHAVTKGFTWEFVIQSHTDYYHTLITK